MSTREHRRNSHPIAALIGLAALASCGGPSSPSRTPADSCPETGPDGDVAELRTPTGEGTRFTAPQVVPGVGDSAGGFIRVAGVEGGRRTYGFGCEQCMTLPDPASDDCPVIEAGTLAKAAWDLLEARGVTGLNGIGLGVGGTLADSDPQLWHFGLGVGRWADADAAIAAVAEVLDLYGVSTAMGVSVRGMSCVVLLGA